MRFAYENGIRAPSSEEGDELVFGIEDDATNADLLTALYVLAGGTPDAEEALGAFSEIGIVPADTDLGKTLTGKEAADAIESLAAAFEAEYEAPETEDDTLTRGALAVLLKDFADAMSEE